MEGARRFLTSWVHPVECVSVQQWQREWGQRRILPDCQWDQPQLAIQRQRQQGHGAHHPIRVQRAWILRPNPWGQFTGGKEMGYFESLPPNWLIVGFLPHPGGAWCVY
jgi:hypothetical protein